MKKKIIIIIIGFTILALLGGTWFYLFFNGSPESVDGVFGSFQTPKNSESEKSDQNNNTSIATTTDNTSDLNLPPLRQLTTVPVAGFTFIEKESLNTNSGTSSATSTINSYVLYAEKGTGHVYELNPKTNNRERISNKTIPNTDRALFSKDGRYGVLLTGNAIELQITILEFTTATSSESEMVYQDTIRGDNFAIKNNDYLFFTSIINNRATGRALHLGSQAEQTIFTLPYVDTAVAWNSSLNGPHYVYPKPQTNLISYAYEVSQGTISRLPISGYSLSLLSQGDSIAYSYISNPKTEAELKSILYNKQTGNKKYFSTLVTKDKCVFSNLSDFVALCGSSIANDQPTLAEWYTGKDSFSDDIWYTNLNTGSSRMLVNIQNKSGRQVDVYGIAVDTKDNLLLFRNKTSGNLWLYEIQ